jgi:hypothetical protein
LLAAGAAVLATSPYDSPSTPPLRSAPTAAICSSFSRLFLRRLASNAAPAPSASTIAATPANPAFEPPPPVLPLVEPDAVPTGSVPSPPVAPIGGQSSAT